MRAACREERRMIFVRFPRDTGVVPSSTTVISVAGILTSGVVGPSALAWWAQRRQEHEFANDRAVNWDEDLRGLLDDAAVLLGGGATNLRLVYEASHRRQQPPTEVGEWASRVHLTRERLLLRLPEDDRVVVAYTATRDSLESILQAMAAGKSAAADDLEAAIAAFEARRSAFLTAAREVLSADHQTKANR